MTLFYFLLALLLLVTVHEYGHFIVARLCGVKVLRFSFGFGKVLLRCHDKRKTEYAFSLIPLGGYIKMLNEEEGPVPEAEKHLAFNRKSLGVKAAITIAGPLFNFLFAFCAIWLVMVVGIASLAPMIDNVIPDSIAARGGLTAQQEIVAFNGHPVVSWRDFQYELMPFIGTNESVSVTVKSMLDNKQTTHQLALDSLKMDAQNPDLLKSLGIKLFIPRIPPIVGEVIVGTPASIAGFKEGDRLLSVNKKTISDWLEVVNLVKDSPGKVLSIKIDRHGQRQTLSVEVGTTQSNGHEVGLLGVRSKQVSWPEGWLRVQREGPIDALATALKQTVSLTGTAFSLIGRLATGKVSLDGISGPVGIAQSAGESARGGFSYYVSFLALVSISLGVLNLLPIPLLDGGHLLFYCIEFIRRRPLTMEFKSVGMVLGSLFLMALMVFALKNDLGRLVGKF